MDELVKIMWAWIVHIAQGVADDPDADLEDQWDFFCCRPTDHMSADQQDMLKMITGET